MSCPFSERFLQIIWNERLLTALPVCCDGRRLRVISSGLWNTGKGPDFRQAVILLEDRLLRGDIELHRSATEWFQHGHHRDSAYRDVILHVVWENDISPESADQTGLPTLELREQLLPCWTEVFHTVETAFYPHAREVQPGACALRWALADDERLREILTAAGFSRFLRHGRELLRRGMESGSLDQALYERVFDALGYAENREPFRQLAQALPLTTLRRFAENRDALLAVLFGTAGLLPDPTTEKVLSALRGWLPDAWKLWWQSGLTVQQIAWEPFGGRPLNSVCRRVAAGALWLWRCQCQPLEWLEKNRKAARGDGRRLLALLTAPLDEEKPWDGMRDFCHGLPKAVSLLGIDRRRALALNVFLPLLYVAEEEGDEERRGVVREAWLRLPRPPENRLLRDAVRRFLSPPSRWRSLVRNAAQQQGMMAIFRNFCLALDHDCNECPFCARG